MMIELHSSRQTYDFDCGANALQAAMAYFSVEMRGDAFLLETGSGRDTSVSIEKMISVAESREFRVEAGQHWTIEKLQNHASEGNPVIVLLQAWVDRFMTLRDWRANYENGH